MQEQLEHMKKWALQDQSALSKEQVCKSFAQMCDDALQELERHLTTDAPVVVDTCPYCKKDHDVRLACPEYKKMLEFRYNQVAGIKPRRR